MSRPVRADAWRAAAVLGLCLALLTTLLVVLGTTHASAHGAVSDPAPRHHGSHHGSHHRRPDGPARQMAAEDPLCHRAWQADPSAM